MNESTSLACKSAYIVAWSSFFFMAVVTILSTGTIRLLGSIIILVAAISLFIVWLRR